MTLPHPRHNADMIDFHLSGGWQETIFCWNINLLKNPDILLSIGYSSYDSSNLFHSTPKTKVSVSTWFFVVDTNAWNLGASCRDGIWFLLWYLKLYSSKFFFGFCLPCLHAVRCEFITRVNKTSMVAKKKQNYILFFKLIIYLIYFSNSQ